MKNQYRQILGWLSMAAGVPLIAFSIHLANDQDAHHLHRTAAIGSAIGGGVLVFGFSRRLLVPRTEET